MDTEKGITFFALQHVTPNWSNISEGITKNDDLNESQKEKGLHAVSVFRLILGEHFFNDNGHDHPLQRRWRNVVSFQIAELSEWAMTLEQLRSNSTPECNLYLSELLKPRKKCEQEGIHFLKLATSLLRVGFNLEFMRGTQNERRPDVKVTEINSGATFYIEVTHLEKKEVFQKNERVFYIIHQACLDFGFNLLTYVRLLKPMTENELKQAIALIAEIAQAANESGKLQICNKEYIEIAFALASEEAAFTEWLRSNDKRKGIYGLPVDADETYRVKDRIKKKVKQIPSGATGIIYMTVEFLYFLSTDRRKILVDIKKVMAPFQQLKGIVLCTTAFDPQPNVVEDLNGGEDLYSLQCIEGHSSIYLYCVNDSYKSDLPDAVLAQFRCSFMP